MVQAPTFRKDCQHEAFKEEVERLLECFRGIAKATDRRTVSFVFTFLVPVLEDCVPLFEVYYNCSETVEILLSFLLDVIETQLGFLSKVRNRWNNFTMILLQKDSYVLWAQFAHSLGLSLYFSG